MCCNVSVVCHVPFSTHSQLQCQEFEFVKLVLGRQVEILKKNELPFPGLTITLGLLCLLPLWGVDAIC